MSRDLLTSKIIVVEEEPSVRGVPTLATSVTGAVGVAETGPLNTAVLCTSFDDYRATFGGFTTTSDLALAVMGFFENGGSQLWVSRVGTSTATAADGDLVASIGGPETAATVTGTVPLPFDLESGQDIQVSVNTLGSGFQSFTSSFEGLPAVVEVSVSEPYAIEDGSTIIFSVDGGEPQTVVFSSDQFADIHSATALEVAAAINGAINGVIADVDDVRVRITTASAGSGSSISVDGGTAVEGEAQPASIVSGDSPFVLENFQELTIAVNGSPVTVQFVVLPAILSHSVLGDEAPSEPFHLFDGQTFIIVINVAFTDVPQTVTFHDSDFADITAATADEVCDAMNAQLVGAIAHQEFGRIYVSTVTGGYRVRIKSGGGTASSDGGLPAIVSGTVEPPFALDPDDDLEVIADGNSASVTFTATPAIIFDTNEVPKHEPFNITDGGTLIVIVDGGDPQTVTFTTGQFADITEATQSEVLDAINSQLTGATASASEDVAGAIVITTNSQGSASSLVVDDASTADGDLGFSDASGAGTGNVANIRAVTIEEVFGLLSAGWEDDLFHLNNDGIGIGFETVDTGPSTTIQVLGTATEGMGLDNDEHSGLTYDPFGFHEEGTSFGAGNVKNIQAVEITEFEPLFIDGGSPAVFVDASPSLRLETPSTGSLQTIQVTGSAAAAMGFDSDVHVGRDADVLGIASQETSGSGNVLNIHAVTLGDVVASVQDMGASSLIAVEDVGSGAQFSTIELGANTSIQIGGAVIDPMGIDPDPHFGTDHGDEPVEVLDFVAVARGAEGNQLRIEVTEVTGNPDRFNLLVYNGATLVETFEDLSRSEPDPRFVVTVINDAVSGSDLVRVTNLDPDTFAPPDIGEVVQLDGGTDGVLIVTEADFIGNEADETGLHAFDAVRDLSLLLVPGRATPAIHNAMLAYCEQFRDGAVFAILDPPAGARATDIVTYVTDTASLENSSEFGAIYWPRVKILNPQKSVFGSSDQILVPPSGIIAGVYARTDGASPGGIYDPPAGTEKGQLFGVLGFETTDALKERKRDLVYPHRINPLTTGPGLPMFIDGSRTLKGDGSFPFVAERRGVIFIERSLMRGLAFARHKNNTPDLRAQVRRIITSFLLTQLNNGAFRGDDPSNAFFVDVSDQLNPPSVVFEGKLIARVGIATNKPAEFVVLELTQDTRALDAELAG